MRNLRKLTPILFLTFVNVIGFSILIPVLPDVVIRFTGESSGLLYGLLLSSYSLSQFVAAPILGTFSDRYGRRPILLLSQFGTLISWMIFASAYFLPQDMAWGGVSVPLLVIAISRILDGVTGGNVSVANAWVSDRTTREEKTKAFGFVGATFGVGFLVGPALGGLSVSTPIHFLGTALLAIGISIVAFAFIYFGLPESHPKENRELHVKESMMEHLNMMKKFKLFRENPVIKNLLMVRVFYSIAFVGFTTSLILLLGRTYMLAPINVGIILSIIGIFSIFNQAVLVPRLSKKFGEFRTFFGGLIVTGLALTLHTFLPLLFDPVFSGIVIVLFYMLAFPLNLGLSMVMTTFKTIITTNTEASKQGQATGLDESISSFGHGVAPIFAGVLYDVISIWAFALYGIILLAMSIKAYRKC